MNMHHDSWWLEEVRDHYSLFKFASSTVFSFGFITAVIAIPVNSSYELQETPTNGLLLFFSIIISLIMLMWYIDSSYNNTHLLLAFIIIELINIMFTLSLCPSLKEHQVILAMISTIITVKYQLGFIQNLNYAFLVIVKHTFMWYLYRVYTREMIFNFPWSIILPVTLAIFVMLSEVLKRQKSYERFHTRHKLESTQRNLQTILDCFPDGLIVLNKDIEIKYSNFKILEYLNCPQDSVLTCLNKNSSIREQENKIIDNSRKISLLENIKNHLSLEIGQESSLGLTEISDKSYE